MSNDNEDVTVQYSGVPAVRERSSVLLMPVMDVGTAMARLKEFQDFCTSYLQESKDGGTDGGDYGVIPGTKKKTLLKSGADKLCEVYGLYDEYVLISSVEDWDKGLFDYTLKCLLKSRRDDSIVGTGVGSCSSFESKYRWRESSKRCPMCLTEAIIKGKAEYGGGWLCWGKKGGCGAKFKDGDQAIEGQFSGRVENPDIVDSKNTVLKMAKKRAKIDATIGVTRSSGVFTQDMEDVTPVTATAPPKVETSPEPLFENKKPEAMTAFSNSKLNDAQKAIVEEKLKDGEFIGPGEQANFATRFREALPKEFVKQVEDLRHQWLARHGFIDKDGNPSAKMIPTAEFEAVKVDACRWARSYSGTKSA